MSRKPIENPLRLVLAHQWLMRLAVVRFVLGNVIHKVVPSSLGISLSMGVSIVLGIAMAYFGYRCCAQAFGVHYGILAAIILLVPFGWVIPVLMVSANIGDRLYQHIGVVGFFGATEQQVQKLRAAMSVPKE